jgi:hypothetical protein
VPILELPVVWGPDWRHSWFRVLSVMAFPEDSDSRRRFFLELVERSLKGPASDSAIAKLGWNLQMAEWQADALADLKDLLWDAQPARMEAVPLRETAISNLSRGMLAGQILWEILRRSQRKKMRKHASLTQAKYFAEKALEERRIRLRNTDRSTKALKERSIEIIWKSFATVSHFYAALREHPEVLRPCRFELPREDLIGFLASAEYFRRAGERFLSQGGRESLLDPAKTWTVDPALTLPQQKYSFPVHLPHELKIINSYKHKMNP